LILQTTANEDVVTGFAVGNDAYGTTVDCLPDPAVLLADTVKDISWLTPNQYVPADTTIGVAKVIGFMLVVGFTTIFADPSTAPGAPALSANNVALRLPGAVDDMYTAPLATVPGKVTTSGEYRLVPIASVELDPPDAETVAEAIDRTNATLASLAGIRE
jgi:hypothetical protein